MGAKHGTASERFWPKVDKRGPDECWLWTASGGSHGYGNLRVKGRTRTSHTLAWELTYGPIADGLWVLHKCDVRRCCNPSHLFLGTAADNSQDMGRKGRHPGNGLKGDRHPNARLTTEQVIEIRRLASVGWKQTAIAGHYGVTVQQINQIVHRKSWKEVA
jgi:hypothetical protein